MGKFIEHVSRIPVAVRYRNNLMFFRSTTEQLRLMRSLEEVSRDMCFIGTRD